MSQWTKMGKRANDVKQLITHNTTVKHLHNYEGNLRPEYELMHQFTVYRVGKRSKICQTPHHSQHLILTRYSQMCPYKGNLPTATANTRGEM